MRFELEEFDDQADQSHEEEENNCEELGYGKSVTKAVGELWTVVHGAEEQVDCGFKWRDRICCKVLYTLL